MLNNLKLEIKKINNNINEKIKNSIFFLNFNKNVSFYYKKFKLLVLISVLYTLLNSIMILTLTLFNYSSTISLNFDMSKFNFLKKQITSSKILGLNLYNNNNTIFNSNSFKKNYNFSSSNYQNVPSNVFLRQKRINLNNELTNSNIFKNFNNLHFYPYRGLRETYKMIDRQRNYLEFKAFLDKNKIQVSVYKDVSKFKGTLPTVNWDLGTSNAHSIELGFEGLGNLEYALMQGSEIGSRRYRKLTRFEIKRFKKYYKLTKFYSNFKKKNNISSQNPKINNLILNYLYSSNFFLKYNDFLSVYNSKNISKLYFNSFLSNKKKISIDNFYNLNSNLYNKKLLDNKLIFNKNNFKYQTNLFNLQNKYLWYKKNKKNYNMFNFLSNFSNKIKNQTLLNSTNSNLDISLKLVNKIYEDNSKPWRFDSVDLWDYNPFVDSTAYFFGALHDMHVFTTVLKHRFPKRKHFYMTYLNRLGDFTCNSINKNSFKSLGIFNVIDQINVDLKSDLFQNKKLLLLTTINSKLFDFLLNNNKKSNNFITLLNKNNLKTFFLNKSNNNTVANDTNQKKKLILLNLLKSSYLDLPLDTRLNILKDKLALSNKINIVEKNSIGLRLFLLNSELRNFNKFSPELQNVISIIYGWKSDALRMRRKKKKIKKKTIFQRSVAKKNEYFLKSRFKRKPSRKFWHSYFQQRYFENYYINFIQSKQISNNHFLNNVSNYNLYFKTINKKDNLYLKFINLKYSKNYYNKFISNNSFTYSNYENDLNNSFVSSVFEVQNSFLHSFLNLVKNNINFLIKIIFIYYYKIIIEFIIFFNSILEYINFFIIQNVNNFFCIKYFFLIIFFLNLKKFKKIWFKILLLFKNL